MPLKEGLDDRDERVVSLHVARTDDAELLGNLLELYIHDLSAAFDVDLGANGRFGYAKLPLYWSEPESRFPFLIRCDGRVVGFVLATRGSPITDDPSVLDVAEFFVLRRYRRSDIGRRAAFLLWDRLTGKWSVRVSQGNSGALSFWQRVVGEYSANGATELERPGSQHAWRVFSFESRPRDTQ